MDQFQHPALYLYIGKSERGKSYLLTYMLQYFIVNKQLYTHGIVFSGTSFKGDWDWIHNENAIVNGWNEQKFNRYIDNIKKTYEEYKKEGREQPHSFCVFDDMLGRLVKSQAFDNFLATYRHYNIDLYITTQYLNSRTSSPLIREQAKHIFAFNSHTERTRESIFEWFGSSYGKKQEFYDIFDRATKDLHTALVIHESKDRENNFYPIKAPKYQIQHITF